MTPDIKMTTTQTRLPDADGSARVAMRTEFANDQYPPSETEYTMRSGFAVDRELIDFMSAVSGGDALDSEGKRQPFAADVVEAIAKNYVPYGSAATFKKTETVGGKPADRYSYTIKQMGDTVETGDIWLSDAVPFGIVKMSSTTKDASGKVTQSFERVLVSSGVKPGARGEGVVTRGLGRTSIGLSHVWSRWRTMTGNGSATPFMRSTTT